MSAGGRGAVNIETPPAAASGAGEKATQKKAPRSKAESHVDAKPVAVQATPGRPAVVPPPAQEVSASVCCARVDLPFPTEELLRKGSTTAEIRAEYGAPTLDITGTRNGRVLERYYYVNRDQTRLTVANLENGLLTSVESLSSPYFKLPGPGGSDAKANSPR